MPAQSIRLNKYLAERLGVSRREADELISAGKITIDGRVAKLGDKVFQAPQLDKTSKVCYNGKIVPNKAKYLYLALNKPVGYVCSRHAQGTTPTLYELLPAKYRQLKTVGRLDKDSSGLILLTNDGDFAYQMTHPKFRKTKIYEVELNKPLQPLHQQMISDYGVLLDDGVSKFTIIKGATAKKLTNSSLEASKNVHSRPSATNEERTERVSPVTTSANERVENEPFLAHTPNSYTVVLTEGRNRQIRRTFAALGYTVTKLHRTDFGKYKLNHLASGKYAIINI